MSRPSLIVAAAAVLLAAAVAAAAGPAPQDVQVKPNRIGQQAPVPALLKPDLRVKRIWFAQYVENPNVSPLVAVTGSLKLGVKVYMVCDLVNDGPGAVKSLWLLGYSIDDAMAWNNSWSNLAAGAPLRGLGPYTPASEGTHRFKAVLDVNNEIKEGKEDNNQMEVLFQVVK